MGRAIAPGPIRLKVSQPWKVSQMRKRPDFYFNGRHYLFNGYGRPAVILQGIYGYAPGTKWL